MKSPYKTVLCWPPNKEPGLPGGRPEEFALSLGGSLCLCRRLRLRFGGLLRLFLCGELLLDLEGYCIGNRLIFGDNLLALKALEQELSGKIKCVFIEPPYNTGSAFTHYDDGLEHSIWLSLIRDRLELIRRLLSPDGSLWISIDDNEAHYLKVLCDEIFGRFNFVANAVWQKSIQSRMIRSGSQRIMITS
jgi:hypothetical protein